MAQGRKKKKKTSPKTFPLKKHGANSVDISKCENTNTVFELTIFRQLKKILSDKAEGSYATHINFERIN